MYCTRLKCLVRRATLKDIPAMHACIVKSVQDPSMLEKLTQYYAVDKITERMQNSTECKIATSKISFSFSTCICDYDQIVSRLTCGGMYW